MLFAAAGYEVFLYDSDARQRAAALDEILVQLKSLDEMQLLRGTLSVQEQHQRIRAVDSLESCVHGAVYVQECVPENFDLKRAVFSEMDQFVDDKTILASSTSSMPCSSFTSEMIHKSQVIVAHPVNPPFYCPLTEIVPAPYTADWVKDATMKIMEKIGQSPVLLKKEIIGFAVNRIQYALLSECWRLIQDDAISVTDLDKVMSDGLGMRYAFMGPLQTCHLNAEGMLNYCERYGEMIYSITSNFGPNPRLTGETGERIAAELMENIPVEQIPERRIWRDKRLAALAQLKKSIGE